MRLVGFNRVSQFSEYMLFTFGQMLTELEKHIEEIKMKDCTALHITLGGLCEDDTLALMDVLQSKIDSLLGDFVTVYAYSGFLITPKSKTKAKKLVQYVDSTGRSKGTIAYGADYFVRLIGSIIRPSTVFVMTKKQAFDRLKEKCSSIVN